MDRNRQLAVFFSHGISLATWEATGLMPRELAYYRALGASFGAILFVTYDTPSEELPARLAKIEPAEAVYNRWNLPYRVYGVLAPLLHRRRLRRATILKTNQISGAWTAVLAKWLLRKPLVVRCGFVASQFVRREGAGRLRLALVLAAEKFVVRAADLVFAATQADIDYLAETHGVAHAQFRHIPTPIDTDRLAPPENVQRDPNLVVFVGRLSPQKNVDLLIEACQSLPNVRLRIIGGGPLEAQLRAKSDPARVTFTGVVPNAELPRHLHEAAVVVLPSNYEGSPKSLLEAMAASAAVVGTRVTGIREVIEDGVNGLLADVSASSIADAIGRLMADASLRERLGAAARQFVVGRYSQADVVRRETEALASLER